MSGFTFSIETSCGHREMVFDVPGECRVESVRPTVPGAALTPGELGDILNRGGWDHRARTLFVVNDHARPTPTTAILSCMDPPLEDWADPVFVVATGSHRPPGKEELESIFGVDLLGTMEDRILIHEAGESAMVSVGRTVRGTQVSVNEALFDCRQLVTIGSVEPHYFAGYTGGRKSIIPGLASFETIRQNHAMTLDPGSRVLELRDNPLNLDLEEGTRMVLEAARRSGLESIVAVNAVNLLAGIFHLDRGSMEGSVERCREAADNLFVGRVGGLYPVVIAVAGYPLSRDLYQALKAFEHGRMTLSPGGVLILVSDCDMGLGPDHFARLMTGSEAGEMKRRMAEDFELGAQKFANLINFSEEGSHLFLVSPAGLPEMVFGGMRRFERLEEAVGEAAALARGFDDDRRLLVIEEATNLVPNPGP
jgi:nickel-dependent lactate racemase